MHLIVSPGKLHKIVFGIVIFAACLLLARPSGAPAAAGSFRIVRGSPPQATAIGVTSLEAGGFLDLGELASSLGGNLAWSVPGEKITWRLGGVELEFEDMIAFFTAGGVRYQLVAEPRLAGGKFLVPLQLATEFLPRLLPDSYAFNTEGDLAVLSGSTPAVQQAQPTRDGKSYRIHTVVIDPGHGGKDPGTLGRRYRLSEKQIVLDICRRVARKIEERSDLKVVLTRGTDEFIPLAGRGQLANKSGAGLFVSVHVNASRNRGLDGSSTYFLSAAKTDEERATAMLENGALKFEVGEQDSRSSDEINLILQDMAQNEYLRESKDLSEIIQRELARTSGLNDRGLRQANFAVLRGAYMPAALIETAYISNPGDEKKLNSPAFRDKLAEAITAGIIKYVQQYHRKLASGS